MWGLPCSHQQATLPQQPVPSANPLAAPSPCPPPRRTSLKTLSPYVTGLSLTRDRAHPITRGHHSRALARHPTTMVEQGVGEETAHTLCGALLVQNAMPALAATDGVLGLEPDIAAAHCRQERSVLRPINTTPWVAVKASLIVLRGRTPSLMKPQLARGIASTFMRHKYDCSGLSARAHQHRIDRT